MKTKKPKKFKHLAGKPETPAAKAILDTLRYKAIFSYPVSFYELWHFLIHKEKVEIGAFRSQLEHLVKTNRVQCANGLYFLPKATAENVEKKKMLAKRHIETASSVTAYLKRIPWVEMVAVTGSVAASNADSASDIDLLIVTESKRLWLSRLFVVLVLKALGIYWNDQKPAGTVCPNIFMSSGILNWEKKNVYIANEIALLYPLFSRNETYFRFMEENSWVKDYLANCYQFGQALTHKRTAKTTVSKLVDLLESVCMKAQKIHMQNKVTTEVIRPNLAHFNKKDSMFATLSKY
ncbi:hypothetical protein A2709_03225 [candidate division WWE3 bacterium RIFCSPHIGHO2_01_FULL_43_9]|uniref:Polymerase nucleotidyl transferase domain-containing protein n=1 Tax=candidate division WWE3 bacterium RIFCSPHIGHO2_01_FULL_43_9 TaxID=1802618 RepID=A0A1F4V5P6_UNCKA|nr:MAG: hypothetical protein A2709_03225 [candidate division WWE3 bacterium RIFCSPHIGHO2_01_FULL_43_9]